MRHIVKDLDCHGMHVLTANTRPGALHAWSETV